jgi:hypothetical protein
MSQVNRSARIADALTSASAVAEAEQGGPR